MNRFFIRWLLNSFKGMIAESIISMLASVTVATLVFCLIVVSSNLKSQFGKELKAYGAHMIALPESSSLPVGYGEVVIGQTGSQAYIDRDQFEELAQKLGDNIAAYAPGLTANIFFGDRPVQAIGYAFQKLKQLSPSWRITPGWPTTTDGALVGASLAKKMAISAGDEINITVGNFTGDIRVDAVFETGGREDQTVMLDLDRLQEMTDRVNKISLALIRADLDKITPEELAAKLEKMGPGIDVRTRLQVAGGETELLNRIIVLLWLVTAAVLIAAGITMLATTGILLVNRRREIGLYLALGAPPKRILFFLLSVAATIGLAGGVLGVVLGWGLAEAAAQSAFDVSAPFSVPAAAAAILSPVALALLAWAAPVRKAVGITPSEVLREL